MHRPPDGLPPDVLAALREGNTIEAIRRLRNASGLGLKEAKDAMDAWQRDGAAASVRPGTVPASVMQAAQRGDRMAAILLLRQHAGMSLKEAKAAVDALPRSGPPAVRAGPRDRSLWWLLAIAIAAFAAYHLSGPAA
jgi:ribosomal protein L7/L12